MNIYIETYGCSVNIHESEIMKGLLQKSGFNIVNNFEIADIIIINSCIVKFPTEQRLLSRLKEMQEKYLDKKLIITGCAPEVIRNKLLEINPNINLVSTHHIKKIPEAVKKVLEGKHIELLGETIEVKLCLPKIRKNPVIDIVPISSGCNSACSYCVTRFAKGKLFSYPKNKILDEISFSLKAGCKEIWITSQDNCSYKLDEYEKSQLPELLNDITKIPGNFFVRVGMMNPKNVLPVLPDLIESFNNKKFYKFLHIPVQSGDDKILQEMRRNYSVNEFEEIVSAFKDSFRCTIWTDIIVGYPTENEEQFRNTLELIKRIKPDYVNISRYGKRPETEASELEQSPTEVLKKRSLIASNLVKNIALEKNREWLDWRGEILISERGKKEGQWIGRNFAYKPVLINKSGNLIGKMIKVKIIDASPSYLSGWPIS